MGSKGIRSWGNPSSGFVVAGHGSLPATRNAGGWHRHVGIARGRQPDIGRRERHIGACRSREIAVGPCVGIAGPGPWASCGSGIEAAATLLDVGCCVVGMGRGEFGFWAHKGGVFARSFSVGVSVIAGGV